LQLEQRVLLFDTGFIVRQAFSEGLDRREPPVSLKSPQMSHRPNRLFDIPFVGRTIMSSAKTTLVFQKSVAPGHA
jgi:hypothetical protein